MSFGVVVVIVVVVFFLCGESETLVVGGVRGSVLTRLLGVEGDNDDDDASSWRTSRLIFRALRRRVGAVAERRFDFIAAIMMTL